MIESGGVKLLSHSGSKLWEGSHTRGCEYQNFDIKNLGTPRRRSHWSCQVKRWVYLQFWWPTQILLKFDFEFAWFSRPCNLQCKYWLHVHSTQLHCSQLNNLLSGLIRFKFELTWTWRAAASWDSCRSSADCSDVWWLKLCCQCTHSLATVLLQGLISDYFHVWIQYAHKEQLFEQMLLWLLLGSTSVVRSAGFVQSARFVQSAVPRTASVGSHAHHHHLPKPVDACPPLRESCFCIQHNVLLI